MLFSFLQEKKLIFVISKKAMSIVLEPVELPTEPQETTDLAEAPEPAEPAAPLDVAEPVELAAPLEVPEPAPPPPAPKKPTIKGLHELKPAAVPTAHAAEQPKAPQVRQPAEASPPTRRRRSTARSRG